MDRRKQAAAPEMLVSVIASAVNDVNAARGALLAHSSKQLQAQPQPDSGDAAAERALDDAVCEVLAGDEGAGDACSDDSDENVVAYNSGGSRRTATELKRARRFAATRRVEMRRNRSSAREAGERRKHREQAKRDRELRERELEKLRAQAQETAMGAASRAALEEKARQQRQLKLLRARRDIAMQGQRRREQAMRYITAMHEQVRSKVGASAAGAAGAGPASAGAGGGARGASGATVHLPGAAGTSIGAMGDPAPMFVWGTDAAKHGPPDVSIKAASVEGHTHLAL